MVGDLCFHYGRVGHSLVTARGRSQKLRLKVGIWLDIQFLRKKKINLSNKFSCSFGLRYVSWYKYLIVSLVFSHLGFWSGNLFLIAPFPDLCLLVPFYNKNEKFVCIINYGMVKTLDRSLLVHKHEYQIEAS